MRLKPTPSKVTKSRFEFEENGETAWLEFDRDDQGWMTLWHTPGHITPHPPCADEESPPPSPAPPSNTPAMRT